MKKIFKVVIADEWVDYDTHDSMVVVAEDASDAIDVALKEWEIGYPNRAARIKANESQDFLSSYNKLKVLAKSTGAIVATEVSLDTNKIVVASFNAG